MCRNRQKVGHFANFEKHLSEKDKEIEFLTKTIREMADNFCIMSQNLEQMNANINKNNN